MLDNRIKLINKYFNVEFHEYSRPGNSVLITSGYGLGLAIADVFTDIKYFIDIDNYRNELIDWEAIAVLIAVSNPRAVIAVGWFTVDAPENFIKFLNGLINCPVFIYVGNYGESLSDFSHRLNRHFKQS